MARPKNEKVEEKDDKIIGSSDILKGILKDNEKDHLNFTESVKWKVSTGSLLLDTATKMVTPSLWRLAGVNNGGKSPQALEIVRNFLQMENSKALWVISEGRFSDENKERCQLKFVTNPDEWENGTVFILESNIYDLVIKTIKDLVLNNKAETKFVFVIDSMDGLITRNDLDKEAADAYKVAGPQVMSKKMLQSLSLGMFKYGHLMVLISQVTAAPKIDPYAKMPHRDGEFSGGNALAHFNDFTLEYMPAYQGDFILDNPNGKLNDGKSKAIGKWAKVKIVKSAVETAKHQILQIPIKYGRRPSGIWVEYELVDYLKMWDFVKVAGAGWITFNEDLVKEIKENCNVECPLKVQGDKNLLTFLEENNSVTEYLVKKFRDLLLA